MNYAWRQGPKQSRRRSPGGNPHRRWRFSSWLEELWWLSRFGRTAVIGVAILSFALVGSIMDGARWTYLISPLRLFEQAAPRSGYGLSLCGGTADRTCIVDGDSGRLDGEYWRLERLDAPSAANPGCAAERSMGDQTARRLVALMTGGYTLSRHGLDLFGRTLVRVTLADGRDVGSTLVAEGLALPWPSGGNAWCRQD